MISNNKKKTSIMKFTKLNYVVAFLLTSLLFTAISCNSSDSETVSLTLGQRIVAKRWQTTEVYEDEGTNNKIEDYPGVVSVSTWTLAAGKTDSGVFEFRNVTDPEGTPRAQGTFEFVGNIRFLTFPNGNSTMVTMKRLNSEINEYTQTVPQQIKGVAVVPQKMVVIRVVHKPYPLK
jgi:hypothetical protein